MYKPLAVTYSLPNSSNNYLKTLHIIGLSLVVIYFVPGVNWKKKNIVSGMNFIHSIKS